MTAAVVWHTVDSLTPSPQQIAQARLGVADASITDLSESAQGASGRVAADPEWVAGVPATLRVARVDQGVVDFVAADGTPTQFSYVETALPALAFEGSVRLLSGQWPTGAGQCVASPSFNENHRVSVGSWPLRVTGRVKSIYSTDSSTLMCAPGTWELWKVAPDPSSRYTVRPTYFLNGPDSEIRRVIAPFANIDGGEDTAIVELRSHVTRQRSASANEFFGSVAPFSAVLGGICAVFAVGIVRWADATARIVGRVGFPPKLLIRTATLAVTVGAGLFAFIGGIAGSFVALAVRPIVSSFARAPLAPWEFGAAWVLVIGAVGALGGLAGILSGRAFTAQRLRQVGHPRQPLTNRQLAAFGSAAVAFALAGVYILATAGGELWTLTMGSLAFAPAAASFAPLLLDVCARWLASRGATRSGLMGRVLHEDGRRWATTVCVLAGCLATAMVLFASAAGSVAGQVVVSQSQVPRGSMLVETANPSGVVMPARVLEKLQSDVGVRSPVPLRDLNLGVSEGRGGILQGFDTAEDAQRVLGLTAEQVGRLRDGAILRLGAAPLAAVDVVDQSGAVSRLPVVGFNPSPTHRFATGYGYVLTTALPPNLASQPSLRTWALFQGMSPEQDLLARQWPQATGFNVMQITTYYDAPAFAFPFWLTLAFFAFGCAVSPLVAGTLARELRTLRPVGAVLYGCGMPKAWMRRAFVMCALLVVSVAVVAGAVMCAVQATLLQTKLPTVFAMSAAPWWVLAAFLGIAMAASVVAVARVTRNPSIREAIQA